jgi:hypothetical protein
MMMHQKQYSLQLVPKVRVQMQIFRDGIFPQTPWHPSIIVTEIQKHQLWTRLILHTVWLPTHNA